MNLWCRKWPDGCRRCGVKKKRIHAGQGLCSRCYHRARRRGLQPSRNEARIRVSAGETQFFCHDCSTWKSYLSFAIFKQRTKCNECRRKQKRARYAAHRDEINQARREKQAKLAELVRLGDARLKKEPDPWAYHAIVPMDLVDPWLEQLFIENEGSWVQVGFRLGYSDRRIRTLRNREISRHGLVADKVSVDVAEKIARAADKMDELREFLVPGVVGWAKEHLHCVRCGRYDIPHQAHGLCKRCYQNRQYHAKRGHKQPPPKEERWATWYLACVRCGRSEFKHQGNGVCAGCYQQVRRERKAHEREDLRPG